MDSRIPDFAGPGFYNACSGTSNTKDIRAGAEVVEWQPLAQPAARRDLPTEVELSHPLKCLS